MTADEIRMQQAKMGLIMSAAQLAWHLLVVGVALAVAVHFW